MRSTARLRVPHCPLRAAAHGLHSHIHRGYNKGNRSHFDHLNPCALATITRTAWSARGTSGRAWSACWPRRSTASAAGEPTSGGRPWRWGRRRRPRARKWGPRASPYELSPRTTRQQQQAKRGKCGQQPHAPLGRSRNRAHRRPANVGRRVCAPGVLGVYAEIANQCPLACLLMYVCVIATWGRSGVCSYSSKYFTRAIPHHTRHSVVCPPFIRQQLSPLSPRRRDPTRFITFARWLLATNLVLRSSSLPALSQEWSNASPFSRSTWQRLVCSS